MGAPTQHYFKLSGASVVLNAPDATPWTMKRSILVPWTWGIERVLSMVPKRTSHLVFNCHGKFNPPPMLRMGTGILRGDASAFETFSHQSGGNLDVIWFAGCFLGGVPGGDDFCAEVAQAAECLVVAQTIAVPDLAAPKDHIIDYSSSMPKYYDQTGCLMGRAGFLAYGTTWGLFRTV